jgi:hypothetical protein
MTSLNPLAPVTDYQSMLNRIFWFTSASALVAVWMLRLHMHNPTLNALLKQIDFQVEFGVDKAFPVPGGFLFPALAVGMLTRVFRLHAHVSDWLGIRESFDIEVIMREFASVLAIDVTPITYEMLSEHRHSIMRTTFYAFVSGSQPSIDQQLIHQALDAWSWFWVGVEATLVFILAGLGLVASGASAIGLETIGGAIALAAFGLPAMRGQCVRYAIAQVRAIAEDRTRAAAIRQTFAQLTQDRYAVRRAA